MILDGRENYEVIDKGGKRSLWVFFLNTFYIMLFHFILLHFLYIYIYIYIYIFTVL